MLQKFMLLLYVCRLVRVYMKCVLYTKHEPQHNTQNTNQSSNTTALNIYRAQSISIVEYDTMK